MARGKACHNNEHESILLADFNAKRNVSFAKLLTFQSLPIKTFCGRMAVGCVNT